MLSQPVAALRRSRRTRRLLRRLLLRRRRRRRSLPIRRYAVRRRERARPTRGRRRRLLGTERTLRRVRRLPVRLLVIPSLLLAVAVVLRPLRRIAVRRTRRLLLSRCRRLGRRLLFGVPLLRRLSRRGRRTRQVRRLRYVRLLRHGAALELPGRVRQRRRGVEAEPVGSVPPRLVVVVRTAVFFGCPVRRSGPVRRGQLLVVLGTGRPEVVNHGLIVPPMRRVSATACR